MKFQVARGKEKDLPKQSEEGRLLFTTDTRRIFEGRGLNNPLEVYSDVWSGYQNLVDLIEKNPAIIGKIYLTDDNRAYIYNGANYTEIGSIDPSPYEYYERLFDGNDTNGQLLKIINYSNLINTLNVRSIVNAEILINNFSESENTILSIKDRNIDLLNIEILPKTSQRYSLGISQNLNIYVKGKYNGGFYMNYYKLI